LARAKRQATAEAMVCVMTAAASNKLESVSPSVWAMLGEDSTYDRHDDNMTIVWKNRRYNWKRKEDGSWSMLGVEEGNSWDAARQPKKSVLKTKRQHKKTNFVRFEDGFAERVLPAHGISLERVSEAALLNLGHERETGLPSSINSINSSTTTSRSSTDADETEERSETDDGESDPLSC